jgi:hypothetical protein
LAETISKYIVSGIEDPKTCSNLTVKEILFEVVVKGAKDSRLGVAVER